MLQITSPLPLSKIRYRAKKRGLKIRADGTGNFAVISIQTEPPRPLVGLDHVPLWVIEQVILTPLPEPKPRRKRNGGSQRKHHDDHRARDDHQASHPAAASFTHLIDLLKAQGDPHRHRTNTRRITMTDITAPTQYRPWLKDELARVVREITEMRREIDTLEEGLNDLENERSDLLDQLERLDELYDSFPRDGRVVMDEAHEENSND